MLESTIICPTCRRELKPVGGESSAGEMGFSEHYFCEKCQVNMDVKVKFGITGGDEINHA